MNIRFRMSQTAIKTKNITLFYAFWWILWAVVQFFVLFFSGMHWSTAFADAAVSGIVMAGSGYVLGNILKFYRPGNSNFFHLFTWSAIMSFLAVFLIESCLGILSLAHLTVSFEGNMYFIRFCFAFLMISCMNLFNWLWFQLVSGSEDERRRNDAVKMLREAELRQLRMQLQPHFLFNSLNSISALAGYKPDEARKMIQQLSDFFRGTLKKDEQQFSTLHEEMSHLNLYLDIEKVRFGNRLFTEISISDECVEMKLPALLLQPVVENAIKFGLYDTLDDVTINIMAEKQNSELVVRVSNPYDPETSAAMHGEGFGLSSVRRRLFLLYSRNDLLKTERNSGIFITTIKIPQL